MKYQILQGDNRLTLKTLADNSIDAIITDPPYGIDFLGKSWDANTGALETYQECLRVLKPGGHILAFSAARTYHHLAVTLEQAGFEIRDQIMWIYSSGFPKSQDIGRQIQKSIYGKPDKQRFDPAIMIKVDGDKYKHPDSDKVYRKLPDINGDRLKKSHEGTGYGCVFEEVMNITKSAGYNPSGENKPVDIGVNGFRCYTCGKDSAARYDCKNDPCQLHPPLEDDKAKQWSGWGTCLKPAHEPIALARKPIKGSIKDNVVKHGVGALNIDATRVEDRFPSNVVGEILQEDYQKYFYCPKVSRKERHIGFDLNKVPTIEHNDPATIHLHPLWTPAIGKNVYRLKQAIEEHNAKIPKTNPDGMWDDGVQFQEKKQDIATEASMLSDMGGYYIDENSNETKLTGKNIWLPQTGNIYIHGLKEEYRKWCETNNKTPNVGNNHPTVKPIALMKYLIKLITPPGGIVLDPFNGSGSTGCAAVELGHTYIGCELDPAYVEIANKRIAAWNKQDNTFEDLFE